MPQLRIYPENNPQRSEVITNGERIVEELDTLGVTLERWLAKQPLHEDSTQEEVLTAYHDDVERLKNTYGFQSVDVVSLTPDHPDREAMRNKFLAEHTHSDFEVRFFVDGKGVFYLHPNDKVYVVLCEKGDLISVPANTKHWFDMGAEPNFKCIRLFTIPDGWVGNFTGDNIANKFPKMGEII